MMMKCTVYAEGDLIRCALLFINIVLVAYLLSVMSHWLIAYWQCGVGVASIA